MIDGWKATPKLLQRWYNDREALVSEIATKAGITELQAKLFINAIIEESQHDSGEGRVEHH